MQRIFPENLPLVLQKNLAPFYLLGGADLLLVGESKDHIEQQARSLGFDEKLEVAINNETRWEQLYETAQSQGLFSTRQIIILNLPENLTASQQKQLAELISLGNPDLLLIFHLPKWNKTIEKQQWLSLIDGNSVLVQCPPPEMSKLPQWISGRAKSMNLQFEPDAIQLLAYNYEGNLLALKQALQLLQLRFGENRISLNKAKEVIEQSSQFTPFQWIDALLEGKIIRAERILKHLQQEDVQAVVLLRIIQKELMLLVELSRSPNPIKNSQTLLFNGNLRAEFDRLKIWQNKRVIYQNAISRLTYKKLYQLIQQLAELERQTKQEFSEDIWTLLARFSAQFN